MYALDGYLSPTLNGTAVATANFKLQGGKYGVTAVGTFTSIALQRLGPDGATYVTVLAALTTAGYAVIDLPTGIYQILYTSTSGVVEVLRIPYSEDK